MSSERDKQDPVSFPPPPAGHPKPTEVVEALIYSSVKWEKENLPPRFTVRMNGITFTEQAFIENYLSSYS